MQLGDVWGCLGAKPQRSKILHFLQKYLNFKPILIKLKLLKGGIEFSIDCKYRICGLANLIVKFQSFYYKTAISLNPTIRKNSQVLI